MRKLRLLLFVVLLLILLPLAALAMMSMFASAPTNLGVNRKGMSRIQVAYHQAQIGATSAGKETGMSSSDASNTDWRNRTDEEWKAQLTDEQFYVTREKGTERAFTGQWWDCKKNGVYTCLCCDLPLFSSQTKFESGTGWPSFWDPIEEGSVATEEDRSWFMRRTEALCQRCGAHLGHVFEDGPEPTGLRYCLNSMSLNFVEEEEE